MNSSAIPVHLDSFRCSNMFTQRIPYQGDIVVLRFGNVIQNFSTEVCKIL